jgi:acyl-ACP thioesterase
MTQVIWTQSYAVNTIVVNAQKRLGLIGLLGILQDVAWAHADHLGHGFEATMDEGAIWILSRQKLVVADWPVWRDQLTVRTWVRPIKGPLVHRDYEILVGDRKVGECAAAWLTLDVRTRRPVRPALAGAPLRCRQDDALAVTPEKIALRQDLAEAARFRVRNSDLDMNGHVNNTRYAQWILDSASPEAYRARRVVRYEVNFLTEVQVGDSVAIDSDPLPAPSNDETSLHFQGRRLSDGAQAFAAILGVVEAS